MMKGTELRIAGQTSGPASSAATPLADQHDPVDALYVHVPFCFHKCHYCDFYSFVDSRDRQAPFVDAILCELTALAPHAARPLKTIFVGGGTPTLLRTDLWVRLLREMARLFDLSAPDLEFTVECNPETATAELMTVLRRGGVNRVSIGAQSFDPIHLKTLERWHDPESVCRAIDCARDAGIARRSLDLIFAIPGQTIEQWGADLDAALALPIEHLSCYALTYEPNTAMSRRLERHEFDPCPEDLEADMYELTIDRLRAHGLDRYEVSNFARRGAECRHNLVYWRQGQWLAAGPSASAHIGGHLWKNVPRLGDWMTGVAATGGFSPIVDHEPPDPRRALAERIMMGIRLSEGLDACSLLDDADRFGAREALVRCARRQVQQGNLAQFDDVWRLTDTGFLFADGVASLLMGALHDTAGRRGSCAHEKRS